MDTTEKLGKGISYAHDNQDDKHYFGGFFNLAQNNINSVFDEFCNRLDLKQNSNFNNIIDKYFTDKTSYSDWDKRINVLTEYFPVIQYLNLSVTDTVFENVKASEKEKIRRKYFRENLQSLLKSVNTLRNYYTHYYHQPIIIEEKVFDFLDSTLLKTCLTVKKKRMKNDKTKQILKKSIKSEWNSLEKLKIEELKKNRRANLNDKEAIRNAILNDAFHHLIFNNKETHSLKDFHKSRFSDYGKSENRVPISKSGLVFLLSLFLSKKETEQLKTNIEGFKAKVIGQDDEVSLNNNSLKYMATHWAFSYLSFKGLKRRITNSFDKLSLLTQMIDELSKVPDEVYQTFTNSQKEEFLEDINEFVQDSKNDDNSLEESTVVHPVIRKRYENKFNYFALRFLDEYANFPTLRFQVYAGNYIHDNRPKNIKGSELSTDRIIKERINVFGNLSEVTKYKSDFFSKEASSSEWEFFPTPSYNLVANNIHIYIDLSKYEQAKEVQKKIKSHKEKLLKKLKQPNRGANKITKHEIVGQIYKNVKSIKYKEPTALFSLNELPALLYELLVNGKTGVELENILVQKIIDRYNIVKNYNPTQELSNSFISKKLRKSNSQQDQYNIEKLLRSINKEIEISQQKLDLIKTNEDETRIKDKYGKPLRKYIFYTNELGQEATWLVNDLLRFMPEYAKKNWKGYQHNELQRFFAFYDRHKVDARNLLTKDWNLNSSPFWGSNINSAFRFLNFDEFYEAYLNCRKETLASFIIQIEDRQNVPAKIFKKALNEMFIVFDKRLFTINSTQKQIDELLAKPIVFPRGLFDKKPTFVKDQRPDQAPELYADWYRYCYDESHQYQKFYLLKRNYNELFEKYKLENIETQNNKKELSKQQQFDLFKMKQDLVIKKVKQKDLFIKLMTDTLYYEVFNQKMDIHLKDLYQTKEERYNNQLNADKQKDRSKGDKSENIFNDNFIWNKTVSVSLFNGQIFEPDIKLKDIGKLRKIETDIKVHHLLSYEPTETWNKLMIEDELENKPESYERIRREKLLNLIQVFEKYILNEYAENTKNHPIEFELKGVPNFRLYITKGILERNSELSASDFDWLNNINNLEEIEPNDVISKSIPIQKAYILILLRNKFGHNQLPNKDVFDLIQSLFKKEENETFSSYFLRVTEQVINELTSNQFIDILNEKTDKILASL